MAKLTSRTRKSWFSAANEPGQSSGLPVQTGEGIAAVSFEVTGSLVLPFPLPHPLLEPRKPHPLLQGLTW